MVFALLICFQLYIMPSKRGAFLRPSGIVFIAPYIAVKSIKFSPNIHLQHIEILRNNSFAQK